MEEKRACPWEDGYYKLPSMTMAIFKITGETARMVNVDGEVDGAMGEGTWKFGEFGEAHTEVAKVSGKKFNNVAITMFAGMWDLKGVLSDDAKKITLFSMTNEVDAFIKMSEEEVTSFRNWADPVDAPSSHYKIQPEFQGKLLWISGAPGSGKSTTGLCLSRTADYVYYEADAFGANLNPYIPPDVDEPSLATMKQKPLKGVPQDRVDANTKGIEECGKLMRGEQYDMAAVKSWYTAMCKDIKAEKSRMGGHWVVAEAVPMKVLRDHIKKELGPELIFIVLNMSKEDQIKRIEVRQGEGGSINDKLINLYDMYERATDDEERAINVDITCNMSREDVAKKILQSLP